MNKVCKGNPIPVIYVGTSRNPLKIVSLDGKVMYERIPEQLALTWKDCSGLEG